MAENHPVAFPVGDRGARARRARHPRRSALQPHLGDGRPLGPDARRLRHRPPRRRWCATRSSTAGSSRDYVAHYTNAAVILREDFRDTEDLGGLFSGWDDGRARIRSRIVAVRGRSPRGPAGIAKTRRSSIRAASTRCCRRHFARYTPEMVERACGVPQDQFREPGRDVLLRLRPRADRVDLLRARMDAALEGLAVHPHRRDPAAAARQHRPAGRRHHGAARPRVDPGLDRHPDAVRSAARLPDDAATSSRTRTISRPTCASSRSRAACGRTSTRISSACSRPTTATPRPRRTTSASAGCRG